MRASRPMATLRTLWSSIREHRRQGKVHIRNPKKTSEPLEMTTGGSGLRRALTIGRRLRGPGSPRRSRPSRRRCSHRLMRSGRNPESHSAPKLGGVDVRLRGVGSQSDRVGCRKTWPSSVGLAVVALSLHLSLSGSRCLLLCCFVLQRSPTHRSR